MDNHSIYTFWKVCNDFGWFDVIGQFDGARSPSGTLVPYLDYTWTGIT